MRIQGSVKNMNEAGRGLQPICIKLSTTSRGQLFADKVVQIRKAVQIWYLLQSQLPRRKVFSILLEQPFQAGQQVLEQVSESLVKEGFQKPPSAHGSLSIANFKIRFRKYSGLPKKILFAKLNRKLVGYYNYYGVTGNFKSLNSFVY